MCQEGLDEYRRFKRDKEVNSSRYYKLTPKGKISVSSAELKVIKLSYFLVIRRFSWAGSLQLFDLF